MLDVLNEYTTHTVVNNHNEMDLNDTIITLLGETQLSDWYLHVYLSADISPFFAVFRAQGRLYLKVIDVLHHQIASIGLRECWPFGQTTSIRVSTRNNIDRSWLLSCIQYEKNTCRHDKYNINIKYTLQIDML